MKTRLEVERELRQWLRNHHGVIGRYEAVRLGASSELIRSKLNKGEWARMYRGVYRDTAVAQTPLQDLRGAVVATHGAGVVSHTSAGWLWDLLSTAPTQPELTIFTGTSSGRGLSGMTIHRSRDIDWSRTVTHKEILVTNPLRTIVDLASSVTPVQLTDAVDAALAKRLVTVAGITAELERLSRPGRPGVATLRFHLRDRGFIGAPTASVLEAKMLRLITATGLPPPTVELTVGPDGEYRLDFAWPDVRFSVEVDGYVWHFTPEHQRRDQRRRNQLQRAGWTALIYTWRDVRDEPGRLVREIARTYQDLQDHHPQPE